MRRLGLFAGQVSWGFEVSTLRDAAQVATVQYGPLIQDQVLADRFKVVRFIDRGGMGAVYEVQDQLLQGVHVALKVILPQVADDPGAARRLEQEVLLARKVTHRHLCPIYDIARCPDPPPGFLFLTMKLLSGETLARRLQRVEKLSAEEAVAVFRQMCSGVAALHAGGVIHRDLKPNNVMLDGVDDAMCLYIMDFGLARLHASQTTEMASGMIAGTPGYLAPELMLGQPPSRETDLFALGVLLHRAFAGEAPVVDGPRRSVRASTKLQRADIHPALLSAVAEFLSDDPQRRALAFREVQANLELGGASLLPTSRRVRSGVTRRGVLLAAASACILGGAALWETDRLFFWMHPLPRKRFVALLAWPTPRSELKPVLSGFVDAMAKELSRAEALDDNLLIMEQETLKWLRTPAQVDEEKVALGANLVLATTVALQGDTLDLHLSVLESPWSRPLREATIRGPAEDQRGLQARVMAVAARLLNVPQRALEGRTTRPGNANREAYALFQAAEALRREENDAGLEQAIARYKQALELDPRYAEAQARLAWAYLRWYGVNSNAAALTLARENAAAAVELNPESVDGHLAMAWADAQTGEVERAAPELARALALDPGNSHTLSYQGKIFSRVGRYAEAEAAFGRALRLRPNYWIAHNELAVIYSLQGKYSLALAQFQSASLAAPRNVMAIANTGWMYLCLGQLSKAADAFQKSLAFLPNGAGATGLAEMSRVQHKYAQAVGYAQQATKIDPTDAYAWLELGDCLAGMGDAKREMLSAYGNAVQAFQDHLATEKKDGAAWMLLALSRTKAGKPDTAATLVEKAETLYANDIYSQLAKVRVCELIGRRDVALATIKQCLTRGPTAFQIETMPDLERLRKDPRYKEAIGRNELSTTTAV